MIKYQKLPINILGYLPATAAYLISHPKVIFSYLFGSLTQRKPAPLSDVDIAAYLKPDADIVECKLAILGKLIDIFQSDEIDLVVLNTAQLALIMNVLKSKKVIVNKNPFARHIFESLTMRKFFDFSIKESAILHRRYLNG